tara:strand:+ start:357 stop:755 length:399 start_codon:yes stop_codon:yes gene_type:complete
VNNKKTLKIPYNTYIICWPELYYLNRSEDIENGNISKEEFTLEDLNKFFKNNIEFKKVGRGEQVIYTINNKADFYILQNIFYDLIHYTERDYKEYDFISDPLYSRSVHKKHYELAKEKYEELLKIKEFVIKE